MKETIFFIACSSSRPDNDFSSLAQMSEHDQNLLLQGFRQNVVEVTRGQGVVNDRYLVLILVQYYVVGSLSLSKIICMAR